MVLKTFGAFFKNLKKSVTLPVLITVYNALTTDSARIVVQRLLHNNKF
jgi:hypothetical protein